jgi:hypothetical protein
MSNETAAVATLEEKAPEPLFYSEKNGVKVPFFSTKFQRAGEDSGKQGLEYPAPDIDWALENMQAFITYVGVKSALTAILAKVKQNAQAVFEASCPPKVDTSTGQPILDDGETVPDYELFDLTKFQKQIVEGTISSESKAELEEKQKDLMARLLKVSMGHAMLTHATPEQAAKYKDAVLELKGDIELTKIQIEKKKRVRKTELPATLAAA